MSDPRFYLPGPWPTSPGDSVELSGPEAHHLLHVLRLVVGADVVLFDGMGVEAGASITNISRSAATLVIRDVRTSWDRAEPPLILCCAVPKGDRFDWLIEKATEVGVTRFVPLLTSRSVVDPRATKLERLRQVIVSAAKQCGRSRLMQLDEPTRYRDSLTRELADRPGFLADPSGSAVDRVLVEHGSTSEDIASMKNNAGATLFIGPEGGFTPEEIQSAVDHLAKLFSLGSAILRIETAAVVASAFFRRQLSESNNRQ
ncbi:MAG: RsmE family RNA methyltransferase [Planctomycetaceae bacterium]